MASEPETVTESPEDNLVVARRAIARLEAISFADAAKSRPGPQYGDGPLVRAARKLERLLGIRP